MISTDTCTNNAPPCTYNKTHSQHANTHNERIEHYETRFKNSLAKLNVPTWLNKDLIIFKNTSKSLNSDLELRKTKSEFNIKYINNYNQNNTCFTLNNNNNINKSEQQQQQQQHTISSSYTSRESINNFSSRNQNNNNNNNIENKDLKFQPKIINSKMINGDNNNTLLHTKSTSNIILKYGSESTHSLNSNSSTTTRSVSNTWYKPKDLQLPQNILNQLNHKNNTNQQQQQQQQQQESCTLNESMCTSILSTNSTTNMLNAPSINNEQSTASNNTTIETKKKMDENELLNISFEEKSELIDDYLLNDSNNFPPLCINYDDSQAANNLINNNSNNNINNVNNNDLKSSGDNTLDNILTNSSSISNDIQLEIYDNLMSTNTSTLLNNKQSYIYTPSVKVCMESGGKQQHERDANSDELREYEFDSTSSKLTKHKTLYFNNNNNISSKASEATDDVDDECKKENQEQQVDDVCDVDENEDEFFLIQTDTVHDQDNIIEEEPYYLINQDADSSNSKLIRYHQYEINRLSNIIEEDDDDNHNDSSLKSLSEHLKINIIRETESFMNEEMNKQDSVSTVSPSSSTSTTSNTSTTTATLSNEFDEEPVYKSTMRKRSFDLGTYRLPMSPSEETNVSALKSGNPILDILISKLSEQNQSKKSSPIPHESTDSFERLERKFQRYNEEELFDIKTNINLNDYYNEEIDDGDDREVDTVDCGSDYDDLDKFEENGKGYTVFYTEETKPLELVAPSSPVHTSPQISPSKNLAITALKIENKSLIVPDQTKKKEEKGEDEDEEDEYDTSEITSDTNEEEIILIGEKSDIKNLLSNDNNQLENLLMAQDKSKQAQLHYKHVAKLLINDVMCSSLDKVNTPSSVLNTDDKENIFEYYTNLEKSLLQVRSEIDQLKQEAYEDLEYINKVLKNDQEILVSEHEEGDFLTPAQSFNHLMPPNSNEYFSAVNSMCEDVDATLMNGTSSHHALSNPSTTTSSSTCTLTTFTRPSIPPPQVPSSFSLNQQETIKKSKSINLQEANANIDRTNTSCMNKSDTQMHKSLHNLNSTTTTTTILPQTNNAISNSIKSPATTFNHKTQTHNQICKNILDKCLKFATHNTTTSLFDLNLTKQTKREEKLLRQQQLTLKNTEKKFLKLQNINNNNQQQQQQVINDFLNEYRIPSSRHFCGRLLSAKIDQQENSQPKVAPAQPRKSLKSIKNQSKESQQQQAKMINSISHSNLLLNETSLEVSPKPNQHLSKSTKDIRNFVSNSYSPSVIIKPPLASSSHHQVGMNTLKRDETSITKRTQSVDRPINELYQQQQSFPILKNQKLNSSNLTHVNIDIDGSNDDALLDSILDINKNSPNRSKNVHNYSSSNQNQNEYENIKNNYSKKRYENSLISNKKTTILSHSQVIYKCDYLNCKRFRNEFIYLNEASSKEDLKYLKFCHYCNTNYCSKECRAYDWEQHKMNKCYLGRLSSVSKRILSKIGRNLRLRVQIGNIAKTAYLSTGKRGFVWLDFVNFGDAQQFLLTSMRDTSFSEFLSYFGTSLIPKYVCYEFSEDAHDLFNLRQNTSYFTDDNKKCNETSESAINELFCHDEYLDDYHQFKSIMQNYNASNEFILLVSIQIEPNEIPRDLLPRHKGPFKRKYSFNFMTLKYIDASNELASFQDDKQTSSGTLILTSLKSDSQDESRNLFMANLLIEFEQRGINLKQTYPRLYSNLCAHVEHSRPLTPLCLFPRDLNTKNLFMCLIVPNSEQSQHDWVYECKENLEDKLNLKNFLFIV